MTISPAITVVICTYNRLRMLEAAVMSCLKNATTQSLLFEIIIADNSPNGHAAALVARLADSAVPVRRVAVAPPNISIARNAGLRAARAPLVAFLDDDLEVEPGWLDALAATLNATKADIAVGPLRPRFADDAPPAWDRTANRFTRFLPAPSGTRIVVGGKLRTKGFAATTASSLWRAESCFADAMPFDPAFGASGGEDLDLFLRLEARGCRLVWCAEAVVWETVPAERKALSYNLMRAYSGAQVYAASVIKNATSPPVKAFDVMARGAIQTVSLLWLPFIMLLGGVRWQQQLITIASGLGKVLWWHKLPLYHIEKPPPNA